MSDNSLNQAEVAAPESGNTAVPETELTGAPGEAEAPEPKYFTQEELDRIVGEAKAKERRKLQREQAQQNAEPQRTATTEPPKPEQYRTTDEYAEALIDHAAEQKLTQREQQKQRNEAQNAFADREENARSKYTDYDRVYKQPEDGGPRITAPMAETLIASDIGPDIAYWLSNNVKESERISELPPLQQAREIGKIEASLVANPPVVKKVSSAPEPINPGGSRSHSPTYSTSDPRSTKVMDTSSWIDKRNAELRAKG